MVETEFTCNQGHSYPKNKKALSFSHRRRRSSSLYNFNVEDAAVDVYIPFFWFSLPLSLDTVWPMARRSIRVSSTSRFHGRMQSLLSYKLDI